MSQLLEVSLAECLEVKGRPLEESELWALLTQTLEKIEILFGNENITKLKKLLPLTPDSIILCPNGQTDLTLAAINSTFYEDCLPPEFLNNSLNTEQLEKMFIYSLGMSIYSAADYGLASEQNLNISPKLDEFLGSMCSKDPKNRINLDSALKACSGKIMSVTPVLELHGMVLGQTDVYMHSVEEKTYDYSYEIINSRKIPVKSEGPSDASTIHYILLNCDTNARSSMRSDDMFHGLSKATEKENLGEVLSEAEIEEAFTRLNARRRNLESLRKGLRKLENDDGYSLASVNLTRLSHFGLGQSTLNSQDGCQPMSFLSTEYEWLDKRAKEIDDWRRTHLQEKEMIITPDPMIKEDNLHQGASGINVETDAKNAKSHGIVKVPLEQSDYALREYPVDHILKLGNFEEDIQLHDMDIQRKTAEKQVPSNIRNFEERKEVEKEMVGPEFKHPHPQRELIVREATLITESNIRHCKVVLLDGSELDVVCCPSNSGQQLYECIASYLLLKEPHLFGLAIPHGDELQFLDKHQELRKVAPLDWVDKKKFGMRQASSMILHLCVQYFVRSLDQLRYQSTLHMFYLQLRQHLLSERFQVRNIQDNFFLAALALQAEYGKREEVMMFSLQDYLPPWIIMKSGDAACRSSALSKLRGMSTIPRKDAERTFVMKCMSVQEYGYHFYRISRNDSPMENKFWIGIGLPGIVIGMDLDNARVLHNVHPWGNTMKISYRRHRFSIRRDMKTDYYTGSFKRCRYFLWLASTQHFFSMASGTRHLGFIDDADNQPKLGEKRRHKTFESSGVLVDEDFPSQSLPNNSQPATSTYPSNHEYFLETAQGYDQEVDIQLEGPNKLLNYMQTAPQTELHPFNFDEVVGQDKQPTKNKNNISERRMKPAIKMKQGQPVINVSQPNVSTLPSKQEYSLKPLSSSMPQLMQRDSREKGVQLGNQNKMLNYMQTEPEIELPSFNIKDDIANSYQPFKNNKYAENPINSRASPYNSFKASGNSINLKPPMKAPRLFKDSQMKNFVGRSDGNYNTGKDMISSNTNDISNSATEIIPSSLGIKSSPLFQNITGQNEETALAPGGVKGNGKVSNADIAQQGPLGLNGSSQLEDEMVENSEMNFKPQTQLKKFEVTLERKPIDGYGIGLGKDRIHEGVFIASLKHGGVADLDGRLMPGDEIKTVNGMDVSGKDGYSKAIELMSQSVSTLGIERKVEMKKLTVNKDAPEELPKDMHSEPKAPNVSGDHPLQENSSLDVERGFITPPPSNYSQSNRIEKFDSNLQATNHNRNNNNENSPVLRRQSIIEFNWSPCGQNILENYGCNDSNADDDATSQLKFSSSFFDTSFSQQELSKVAEWTNITDLMLLQRFEENFIGLHLKNYGGEELDKMIVKLEKQLKSNQLLSEFRSLSHPRKNYPCTEGSKPDNRIKNRYQNVLPFDSSRIILKSPWGPNGNDYINASLIKYQVERKHLAFVATQAPMENTVADFWTMIWQTNARFIAMLTKEFENGQNKCYRYWPDHKLVSGRFEITHLHSHQLEDFDVKLFALVDVSNNEKRLLCCSCFYNWPHDLTALGKSFSILKFISMMDEFSNEAPVVIHCSSGIGRTGVLMVLEICIQFTKHDAKFDLNNIIEELRMQRSGIIQTLQQYRLCCRAILDFLKLLQKLSSTSLPL